MTKKILIATGGTGGHVIPAYSLANYLMRNKYDIKVTIDKRGFKFLKKYKNINFITIESSPFIKKSFLKAAISLFIISYSILKSLLFLLFNRPSIVIGMGGYSSFPICIAAAILNIELVIYESNLIIGKANKYLLPFVKKIFVSFKELEGIPKKYSNKVSVIGNIVREEVLNFNDIKDNFIKIDNIRILVLGGSQAAKIFATELPKVFDKFKNSKNSIKIFQQCQIDQNDQLEGFYKKSQLDHEIFNFTDKIINYYSKSNLVITRSGASVLGELVNIKIPFITIPLPTSADNHQYKNAEFYQKKGYGYLLEEKDIKHKLFDLINSIFKDKKNIEKILSNQTQYTDKDVFKNIEIHIENIINEKINLGQKDVIHFVGIGGIGMSGLAQIMKNMGFNIQGSDQTKNKNLSSCLKLGIKIFIGHSSSNVKKASILVKSTAIKNNNIELRYARKNRIPIYSRAEVLADVVSLKKNIIITGSHGKTTTTSLVAKILSDQKLDPTIINGGVINSFKSNAKLGKGEWAILEADESDGSFLKLPINYSIITNIDFEHLDYYKNYKNLEQSFIEFINKTPPTGKAIVCTDSVNVIKVLKKIKNKNIITYGVSKKSDYQIKKIKYYYDSTTFDLIFRDKEKKLKKIKSINVKLLGKHNVLNAAASLIVCLNLGANLNRVKRSLKNFSGVQRRMTKVFSKNRNDFYDDYAHHPTEISSVLEGVRNVNSERKIISVFEPHRYSRIMSLKNEFSKCFSKSSMVIICPIYAAGERKNLKFDLIKFAS